MNPKASSPAAAAAAAAPAAASDATHRSTATQTADAAWTRQQITIDGQVVSCIVTSVQSDESDDDMQPPVLLVHGWGASLDLMLPLAKPLGALGRRCILLDLPGFGASPEPVSAWSVSDYTKLVADTVQSLNTARIDYVGHSFGGRIGIMLGADYPELVERLVLIDSAGVREQADTSASLRLGSYRAVRTLLTRLGAAPLAERLRAAYNQRYASADYLAASPLMRQVLINTVSQDLRDYARRIAAPTLLLWGEHDTDTPLHHGQLLEACIDDAALIVLEGAGHYSYLEQTERTVRILRSFLQIPD